MKASQNILIRAGKTTKANSANKYNIIKLYFTQDKLKYVNIRISFLL